MLLKTVAQTGTTELSSPYLTKGKGEGVTNQLPVGPRVEVSAQGGIIITAQRARLVRIWQDG